VGTYKSPKVNVIVIEVSFSFIVTSLKKEDILTFFLLIS